MVEATELGDTLLVPDKGHEKGIGFGGPAHGLAGPEQPLWSPGARVFIISPPLSRPPRPRLSPFTPRGLPLPAALGPPSACIQPLS